MPWKISQSDECPASKPHAVMQQTDGKVMGCHATEDAAKKQMAALYATEKIEKSPREIAALLQSLADLISSYSEPGDGVPVIPRSQSTLAPLDMATIHPAVKVCKIDEDKQLVFGWASIVAKDGGLVVDSDDEVIEPEELEAAVYEYVLESREGGELHEGDASSRMVESMIVTPEKAQAMGLEIPFDFDTGWWVGYKIEDAEAFAKVKDGTYQMFSIDGTAFSEEVEVA